MSSFFCKQAPTLIRCCDFKKFDILTLRTELIDNLNNYGHIMKHDKSLFMDTFNKNTPMKEKYIRANNAQFLNKTLNKAMMQIKK